MADDHGLFPSPDKPVEESERAVELMSAFVSRLDLEFQCIGSHFSDLNIVQNVTVVQQ